MNSAIEVWLPKSVILLREYSLEKFTSDLIAGITVGLVALRRAEAIHNGTFAAEPSES